MKKYLRLFLVNAASLWLAADLLEGVGYVNGWRTVALAAGVLTLANLLIKPLIKILLLPINLLTLGAFRWLINVAILYLVTMLIPQFEIKAFLFSGFDYQGFTVPAIHLSQFWTYAAASFLISLTTTFFLWLAKK